MSVITHISVPPDEFKLAQTLRAHESLRIEMERVVPVDGGVVPSLWVSGTSEERIGRAFRDDDDVRRAEVVDRVGDAYLVRVAWTDRRHTLFDRLVVVEATCLEGVGRPDAWHLELRFPSRESLSEFYRGCIDRGVALTVDGIYDRARADHGRAAAQLSDRQYETLRTAFETGYFGIPREITLKELSSRMGISDTAASQRLRRGLQTLLAEELRPSA